MSYDTWLQDGNPLDFPDYLERKPEGFCVWCDHRLVVSNGSVFPVGQIFCGNVDCHDWVDDWSEDKNRQKYVEYMVKESKIEAMIP